MKSIAGTACVWVDIHGFQESHSMKAAGLIERFFDLLLSKRARERSERTILVIAISSYLIHLLLILLSKNGVLPFESKFFKNPIAAIYTPFSFILLYEVYLLVYFLPKSISFYIGKQYEIITLIVIRRIFKDISNLELSSEWFRNRNDLQFTYDVVTSLVLFTLLYLFYRKVSGRQQANAGHMDSIEKSTGRFILLKRGLSVLLVPLLIALAANAFWGWANLSLSKHAIDDSVFGNINNIFFDEFFTVLIIVDVLLLLASFFHSDEFHKIIRNSGFVISTILIKVSFSVEGLVNNALILGAVLFGFLILTIHDLYEKNIGSVDIPHVKTD
jgi:hypothetical protein